MADPRRTAGRGAAGRRTAGGGPAGGGPIGGRDDDRDGRRRGDRGGRDGRGIGPRRVDRRRVAAGAAVICAVGGAVAVTVAVVAGPSTGLTGYVSEAGVAASGYAATYRAGVFGLAAALLLLALALPAGLRHAAALLTVGAAATVVSGSVTCSDGCPLPPFERAGVADLVHGGASIAAVASCVFAMIVVAWWATAAGPRRLSATAAAVALPMSATIGAAMLVLGRGPVVGLLERLLLADIVLWAATLAALLTRADRTDQSGGRTTAPGGPTTGGGRTWPWGRSGEAHSRPDP